MRRTLPAASFLLILVLGACAHKTEPVDYAQYPTTYILFYGTNSADLTEDAYSMVQEAANAAHKMHPQVIEISGFSDKVGSEAANHQLAEHRVDIATKTLVDLGIDPRIITTLPLGAPADEFGHVGDRRVEIHLIKDESAPDPAAAK